jgi:hypothetical protein
MPDSSRSVTFTVPAAAAAADLGTSRRRALAAAWVLVFVTLLAAASPHQAAAAGPDLPFARAAGPGQLVKAADLGSEAELVRFAGDLLPSLLQLRFDQEVRIADWPLAPGVRRAVLIARHEIYAPGARILAVDGGGARELPRSPLAFFWGVAADDPLSGIFISVDPAAGVVESLTQSSGVQYSLRPLTPGKPGLHLLATSAAFEARATAGHKTSWTCGEEELLQLGLAPVEPPAAHGGQAGDGGQGGNSGAGAAAAAARRQAVAKSGGFQQATVDIDTDHQFLANKFANDTTAATSYIATMFATINVMYQRDLQVQLLIGNTILRTSAAGDPYTQPGTGAANANQLNEFSSYWAANFPIQTNPRTVAAMLSGKTGSPYSASGIAWVGGLCSGSSGYSFSQLFTFAADSSSLPGDTLILGHEIGHNFGTRHTHCYVPPIDDCWNSEAGCYSGPTSCPAPATVNGVPGVTGTVMSYCHLFGGGCTSSQVFHPRVIALIDPSIQNAVGVCITPGNSAPPSVTAILPNNGSTLGGNTVTILGSNFFSGATVTLGGVAASNVNVVDAGTITATAGAHSTGIVDVVVTSGGNPGSLAASYFYAPPPTARGFNTLPPCRVIDTRNAAGALAGPALAASQQRIFQIAGHCGIPTSATAVSANVTAIGGASGGIYAIFPGNAFPLGTSTINFGGSQVRATNTMIMLATDGTGSFGVVNSGGNGNQLVVDVNGYFQ